LTRSTAPADGYDPVARATHWLLAGLAVNVVTLGWASEAAARNSEARDSLLLLHRSLGITIFGLVLFRVAWRLRHRPPPLPKSVGRLQKVFAHLTQAGLDFVFVAMPLAGYVNAAAAGHAVSLFGFVSIPPLLPVNGRLAQLAIAAHLVGQYLVYLLVGLHIAGALQHTLVKRDRVLDRMLPRRRLTAKSSPP
jgi:cytochrome b561